MDNLFIKETWINETENHINGNTDFYETFTNNKGELFKSLQKEYGRCISKMYIDMPDENPKNVKEIGWVFEKRTKYDDINDTFLLHTWVELKENWDGRNIL